MKASLPRFSAAERTALLLLLDDRCAQGTDEPWRGYLNALRRARRKLQDAHVHNYNAKVGADG